MTRNYIVLEMNVRHLQKDSIGFHPHIHNPVV